MRLLTAHQQESETGFSDNIYYVFVKVRSLFALYFNKITEVMAMLSTSNRNFLKRITLLGSVQRMTKHGKEKERKKENWTGYWESHLFRILVQ